MCSKLLKRGQYKFCSRSCAAVFNNKPRIKLIPCKGCETGIKSGKSKYCEICIKNKVFRLIRRAKIPVDMFLTISELKSKLKYNTYQLHAKIRGWSRTIYGYFNDITKLSCVVCGYSLHCEVCHIKPISSFDEDTKIVDINNIENLVSLCPNHHWEFDNNIQDTIHKVVTYCNSLIKA